MAKSIVYAITALVLLTLIGHAYAYITWPHEDCNTWKTLEIPDGYPTIELNSGCYVVVNGYKGFYVTTPHDSNNFVVLDGNGSPINMYSPDIGSPIYGTMEVMNSRYSNISIYVDSNATIRMYHTSGTITVQGTSPYWDSPSNTGTLVISDTPKDAQGADAVSISIYSFPHVVVSNSKVGAGWADTIADLEFNNCTFVSSGAFYGKHLSIADSNILCVHTDTLDACTAFSADSADIVNSYVQTNSGSIPLAFVTDPSDINDSMGAYVLRRGVSVLQNVSAKYLSAYSLAELNNVHIGALAGFTFQDTVFVDSDVDFMSVSTLNDPQISSSVVAVAGNAVTNIYVSPTNITPFVRDSNVFFSQLYLYLQSRGNYEYSFGASDINIVHSAIYQNTGQDANVTFASDRLLVGDLLSGNGSGSTLQITIRSKYFGAESPSTSVHLGPNGSGFGDATYVLDGVTLTNTTNAIEMIYCDQNTTLVLNNVSTDHVVTIHPYTWCTSGSCVVKFEGTTNPADFNVQGCEVVDNTVKPDLVATSTQTYEDVAEGNIVEYNVTVTSLNAPADNIPVKVYVNNYYSQYNQVLEKNIPHLDANQSVTLTFDLNLQSSPATYNIYAVVNPDNTIQETNTQNNRTQRFYVNVYRYDPPCGTLTTGMYRFTHLVELNGQSCYFVPSGQIVTFLAGTGIEQPNIFDPIITNEGQLNINGLWGTGKVINQNGGVLMLSYVQPYRGQGITVYNLANSTTYLFSTDKIMLFHFGGTVKIMGPNDLLMSYEAPNFSTSPMSLELQTSSVYYGTPDDNMPFYVDTEITQSNAAYAYINAAPSADSSVTWVRSVILGNGISGDLNNMQINEFKMFGKTGADSKFTGYHDTFYNVILSHPDSSGSNYVEFNPIDSNVDFYLWVDHAIVRAEHSDLNVQYMSMLNHSKVYLSGGSNLIVARTMSVHDADENIYVDTTTAPVTIDVNAISGNPIHIFCAPNGHNFLYLKGDTNNMVVDSSCRPYTDYNKNLTVSISSIPSQVNPDSNYQVVATVTNDASYTDLNNVDVRLYVDGIAVADKYVDIPAHSSASVTFTVHASPQAGSQTIKIVVDPDNNIFESDENDNVATASVVVQTQQAPASAPAPVVGAGGPANVSVSKVLYVWAERGKSVDTALHISWKMGFPATAYLYYIPENGKIYGPEKVQLHTGDNVIPIKVLVTNYGEVGKVLVSVQNTKQTVTIYARPMAQILPTNMDIKALVLGVLIVLGLYVYFTKR